MFGDEFERNTLVVEQGPVVALQHHRRGVDQHVGDEFELNTLVVERGRTCGAARSG